MDKISEGLDGASLDQNGNQMAKITTDRTNRGKENHYACLSVSPTREPAETQYQQTFSLVAFAPPSVYRSNKKKKSSFLIAHPMATCKLLEIRCKSNRPSQLLSPEDDKADWESNAKNGLETGGFWVKKARLASYP
eukprot:TRINITY_DN60114_c0_g1_i1.p1 TRINITY_DN60114_c0_g1~~TRINITY_DN60114_c0_g1_i1.p1  ORF type:complete len:136 (+),score=6.89 TRINITY_DN60114_c0_g1_i1:61-468(+)